MESIKSWKQILLVFSLCFVTLSLAEIRIEIDTQAQLEAVGENVDARCTAVDNFLDILCKESLPANPGNRGYWSSCAEQNCDLLIRLTDVVGGQDVPIRIEVLGFAEGLNSEYRVRWRADTDGAIRNLGDPISNTGGWTTTVRDIDPALGMTKESEILIRLVSSPFNDEVDIVDKITLVYEDSEQTTTTPRPTTTTRIPAIPDEILDHASPLPGGWAINCEYRPHVEDFTNSACPMYVPIGSGSTFGFWSSCGRYCALTYSHAAVQNPPPTSVIVNSFVSGYASLDIWVRVQGVLKLVGTIKDTTWTNTTIPLAQYGADEKLDILFEPSSTRYPNHVDIIDKITIRFT